MKSFKQYIEEKKQTYVKGWTLKNKIHTSTTNFQNWHIKQVANNLSKFGLNKRSLLKIINDAWPDAPETFPNEHIEELENGLADNNVYIEEVLQKKGYCMFVLDPTHGSISGWDEKSAKLGAKVLDDKYLPFEKDGFKLFEIKTIKGKSKYIKSKYDWYTWLDGKQAAGKRTEIGSTMAQFREEYITEILDRPLKWKEFINTDKERKAEFDVGDYSYTIWIRLGNKRQAKILGEPRKMHLEFMLSSEGGVSKGNDDKHLILKTGNAGAVFATVIDYAKHVVKQEKVKEILFSGKEKSRKSLYNAMLKRMKRMGIVKSFEQEHGGFVAQVD